MWNRFLYSPMILRTWRYCFLTHSNLREIISYDPGMPTMFWGKATALTSGSVYLAILFPSLFGPIRVC